MKKLVSVLLSVVLMAALFAGCGAAEKTNVNKLEAVKTAGKLVMATSPDFPPFESLDAEGNVFGIEVEILELICQELGVELEIKQMSFDSVLPGIQRVISAAVSNTCALVPSVRRMHSGRRW